MQKTSNIANMNIGTVISGPRVVNIADWDFAAKFMNNVQGSTMMGIIIAGIIARFFNNSASTCNVMDSCVLLDNVMEKSFPTRVDKFEDNC